MSNFVCDKCGKYCIDSVIGFVSGCEHYPADVMRLPDDMDRLLHERLWDLYERDKVTHNSEVKRTP